MSPSVEDKRILTRNNVDLSTRVANGPREKTKSYTYTVSYQTNNSNYTFTSKRLNAHEYSPSQTISSPRTPPNLAAKQRSKWGSPTQGSGENVGGIAQEDVIVASPVEAPTVARAKSKLSSGITASQIERGNPSHRRNPSTQTTQATKSDRQDENDDTQWGSRQKVTREVQYYNANMVPISVSRVKSQRSAKRASTQPNVGASDLAPANSGSVSRVDSKRKMPQQVVVQNPVQPSNSLRSTRRTVTPVGESEPVRTQDSVAKSHSRRSSTGNGTSHDANHEMQMHSLHPASAHQRSQSYSTSTRVSQESVPRRNTFGVSQLSQRSSRSQDRHVSGELDEQLARASLNNSRPRSQNQSRSNTPQWTAPANAEADQDQRFGTTAFSLTPKSSRHNSPHRHVEDTADPVEVQDVQFYDSNMVPIPRNSSQRSFRSGTPRWRVTNSTERDNMDNIGEYTAAVLSYPRPKPSRSPHRGTAHRQDIHAQPEPTDDVHFYNPNGVTLTRSKPSSRRNSPHRQTRQEQVDVVHSTTPKPTTVRRSSKSSAAHRNGDNGVHRPDREVDYHGFSADNTFAPAEFQSRRSKSHRSQQRQEEFVSTDHDGGTVESLDLYNPHDEGDLRNRNAYLTQTIVNALGEGSEFSPTRGGKLEYVDPLWFEDIPYETNLDMVDYREFEERQSRRSSLRKSSPAPPAVHTSTSKTSITPSAPSTRQTEPALNESYAEDSSAPTITRPPARRSNATRRSGLPRNDDMEGRSSAVPSHRQFHSLDLRYIPGGYRDRPLPDPPDASDSSLYYEFPRQYDEFTRYPNYHDYEFPRIRESFTTYDDSPTFLDEIVPSNTPTSRSRRSSAGSVRLQKAVTYTRDQLKTLFNCAP